MQTKRFNQYFKMWVQSHAGAIPRVSKKSSGHASVHKLNSLKKFLKLMNLKNVLEYQNLIETNNI